MPTKRSKKSSKLNRPQNASEESNTEISLNHKGFRYKAKKVVPILETKEGQEALEEHCEATLAQFREIFVVIGIPLGCAIVAEHLRGLI